MDVGYAGSTRPLPRSSPEEATSLPSEQLPLILTVAEAAKVARVSPGTMYQLAHSDGFPVVRFGRAVRIPTRAFLEWLDAQARTGTTDL